MRIKKMVSIAIVAALIAAQILVPVVFADVGDVEEAWSKLSDSDKGILLRNLWDFAVVKLGNDEEVTVDEVYNNIYASLEGKDIISTDPVPGDGKISEGAVKIIIQKIINNKQIIKEYYDFYVANIQTKARVKEILGLEPDAPAGEVYQALQPFLVPVMTTENGIFARNGNVSAAVARKLLGIPDGALFEDLLGENLNGKVDTLASKVETRVGDYGLDRYEIIELLEIFGLYEDDPSNPSVVSTNPASGANGVSRSASIKITYSKNIYENWEDIDKYDNISLKAGSVELAVDKSISGKVLTITPKSSLAYSTTYTVTVPQGAVTDEVMRPAEGCTFSFTTVTEPITPPPTEPPVEPPVEPPEEEPGEEEPGEEEPPVEEPSEEEKEIGDIIAEIDEEEIEAAEGEALDAISENITGNIEKAIEILEGIDDPEVTLELIETIIGKSAALVQKLEETGKAAKADEFTDTLNKLAGAALKKVSLFREDVSEEAKEVKGEVILGDVPEGELVDEETRQMLKDIVDMAQRLTEILQENNVEQKIKPALYLDASSGEEDIENSNVIIPAALLIAAGEEKIEETVVITDVATMNIPLDAIELKKGDTLTITNAKVEKEQLPPSAREAVGDAPVFKLDIKVNDQKAELKGKVKVTIPYTLKPGDDPEKITVFYIRDDGELENVIGVYDEKTGTVSFEAEHFSNYVVMVNDVRFTDVGSEFWAARYIEVLASKGIVKGSGTVETYKPLNNLTRAEFTAMIVRAFKLFDESAENPFVDVKETDWFYPEVVSGAKAGIIRGRPGGIFAPDDKITREEMATIIANTLTLVLNKKPVEKPGEYLEKFSDKDNIADYARGPIALAVKYGIIAGKPDGRYAPKDNADRAEAAKLVYMILNMK